MQRINRTMAALSLATLCLSAALAQGTPPDTAPASTGPAQPPAGAAAASSAALAVPRQFRELSLGMGLEEVKAALDADGLFEYRGEADVSLLPRPNETVIEVSGASYVRRAFFQFYEGKLFIMIFFMDESKIDHYSVYTNIRGKYGPPAWLSPSESVWTDGATRMSVERPLAVKYVDLATFDALKADGQKEESFEDILRADFLGDF